MKTIQLSIIEELYRKTDIEKNLIKSLEGVSRNISFTLGVLSSKFSDGNGYSSLKTIYQCLQNSLLYNEKLREFLYRDKSISGNFKEVVEPAYPTYGVDMTILQLRSQLNSLFSIYKFHFDMLSKIKDQGSPERLLYSKCMREIKRSRDVINDMTKHVV